MNIEKKILARKYAQAFLNLYSKKLDQDNLNSFKEVARYLKNHRNFFLLLTIPLIPKQVKSEALHKVLKKFNLPKILDKLIDLLLKEQRIQLLDIIFEQIAKLYAEQHGIMEFTVATSHKLEHTDMDAIKSFLKNSLNKEIIIDPKIEKTLIAGVRLQSSTLLWEHSVARELRLIAKALVN